jgi:tetratricopeptide (TPR) repeat protein
MKKIVIIGAGPSGLYFAIKAVQKGMRHVVVYDPRAGLYTRPGHLTEEVFIRVEKGIDKRLWSYEKNPHIKDLERALYDTAISLGIVIKCKRFVRLHEDPERAGVVVESEGNEERVDADYVFDCTGSKREVVQALNRISVDSPLKMEPITELPVSNHFIAYVNMSGEDYSKLISSLDIPFYDQDPLSAARAIVALRQLGWNEFARPRCDATSFGKNKVCLYMHAPDGLHEEQYDRWVQTVLECYTRPIGYQRLPNKSKPRFMTFSVQAEALQELAYKGRYLPTVIPLGDAQIGVDYSLGHGVINGVARIDALFQMIEIYEGQIAYFDTSEYMSTIRDSWLEHKRAIIEAAGRVRSSFSESIERADVLFLNAYILASDSLEKSMFLDILKEISARKMHMMAKINSWIVTKKIGQLQQIHAHLLQSLRKLTSTSSIERAETRILVLHLASIWKEVGNLSFNNKKRIEAIDCYHRALEIYSLPDFLGAHERETLLICSNLANTYRREKQYSKTIEVADKALTHLENIKDKPLKIKEKIIFHLLGAMSGHANDYLDSGKNDEAHALYVKAQSLIATESGILSTKNQRLLVQQMSRVKQRLTPRSEDTENTHNNLLANNQELQTGTKRRNSLVGLKLGRVVSESSADDAIDDSSPTTRRRAEEATNITVGL